MLKLCENGSNIDYLYETSSVLRKATETEISGLTLASVRFGSVRVFKNRNRMEIRFPHIPIHNRNSDCQRPSTDKHIMTVYMHIPCARWRCLPCYSAQYKQSRWTHSLGWKVIDNNNSSNTTKINYLNWRFDLNQRPSSEEAGTQFFRFLTQVNDAVLILGYMWGRWDRGEDGTNLLYSY